MAIPYRGVWVSFLDFSLFDFGSKNAFCQSVRRLYRQCQARSINRVIVHMRPFSDALYPSARFPWSHLITGVQGGNPGFDPLELLTREAPAFGMGVEAWFNPYRVAKDGVFSGPLSPSHPAVLHPELVTPCSGGLYYNPGLAEVVELVADGVQEVVAAYDLAAVQFDDYFYPTTDPAFDCGLYHAAHTGLSLADWRRENVNRLVRTVYAKIKAANPAVAFGISPHGDDRLNLHEQYSNTALWMNQPGYLDYMMPQLYFPPQPALREDKAISFGDCLAQWQSRPRLPKVQLYFGLGAYLIPQPPEGDWLAHWIHQLENSFAQGYAIFRAENLFAHPANTNNNGDNV